MDTKLKQRVIGAVVLTTVAIIILPMLLDGSAEHRAKIEAAIPAPPEIELSSLSVRQVEANMEKVELASEARLPEMIDTTPVDPDTHFSLDENSLPVSWTLQLGSFREQDNAVRLRQSLREAEFRSYILTGESSEGEIYRVFVGPMLDRSELATVQSNLESKFALKGQIIRYRIEEDRNQLGG